MTTPSQLVDEIRELQAKVHGKQIELCMLLGDRDGACHHQREMLAFIDARRAVAIMLQEEAGLDYFSAAGLVDGQAVRQRGR